MEKKHAIAALMYLGAGVATALYTAHLGETGKPHYTAEKATTGLGMTVFAWPYVLFKNFTAK